MKFRLHVIALTVLLGLVPGLAQALGLGELTVRSHLYEPLDADIELLSVGDLGEGEILSNLAGPEEFNRAGIQRFYHLLRIRFQVVRNDAGRLVIRLSTEKPVTEPFLNFLAEVHWPKGRLMREYTILLDPVTYARIMPELVDEPVVEAAKAEPAPVRSVEPTPQPEQPAPQVARQVAPARSIADAPAQKKKDLKPEPAAPEEEAPREKEYGPVQANETLWAIAKSQRPAGVSVHSAMLAIQRVNPDAFINNNINLLKRGAVLRIPTLEEIQGVGAEEARREVARQEEVWRVRREPAAEPASGEAGAGRAAPADDGTLRLVTPNGDEGVSASGAGPEPSDEQIEVLRDQLASSKEQLDESRREGDELRGKVGQLEEQIETLSRLIELKNEQLANLQRTADDGTLAGMDEPAEAPMDEMDAADALGLDSSMDGSSMDDASEMPADSFASDEMGDGDGAADADLLAPAEDDLLGEEPDLMAGEAGDAVTEEPAVAEPSPVTPVKPLKPVPAQPEPSLVDRILGNPLMLGGIGGGLVLLLLGGLFVARRRGSQDDEAVPAGDDDALGLGGDFSLDAGGPVGVDEGDDAELDLDQDLDLGDLSLEEAPTATQDDEELIQDEEEDVPSLDDLGMELTADITGGDSAQMPAESSEASTDSSELEAELDAALGELEGDQGAAADEGESLDLGDSGLGELELDDSALAVEDADGGLGELELDDGDLGDLDLAGGESEANDSGLGELELDDSGLGELELTDGDGGEVDDGGIGELELDDSGLGDLEVADSSETTESTSDNDLGELQLDDSGLDDVSFDTGGAGESADDAGLGELELDDSGLDELSLDEATPSADAATAGDELSVDDELGDDLQFESADEVATKLDLARAYIEMGDGEGAKEILDEVLVEGDDGQKAEAQQLIDQL